MIPSNRDMRPVRPIIRIMKDILAKYSWYILRWCIGWKAKEGDYVWAYMTHPQGYVLHDQELQEDKETGLKAQVVVFRKESVEDPRLKKKEGKAHAMHPGGYL